MQKYVTHLNTMAKKKKWDPVNKHNILWVNNLSPSPSNALELILELVLKSVSLTEFNATLGHGSRQGHRQLL